MRNFTDLCLDDIMALVNSDLLDTETANDAMTMALLSADNYSHMKVEEAVDLIIDLVRMKEND